MRAWKLTMDTSSIGELFILFKITTDFLCHITKYDASFVVQTFREHIRNDYVVAQEIQ